MTRSRTSYLQADTPGEKAVASTQVSQAINQFQNYAANNPQLQSSQTYTNLQYELAGTENRIAVERMRFDTLWAKATEILHSSSKLAQPGLRQVE